MDNNFDQYRDQWAEERLVSKAQPQWYNFFPPFVLVQSWFLRPGRTPVIIDNTQSPPFTVMETSAELLYLLKQKDKDDKFGFTDESMADTRHDLPEVVRAKVKILGQFPIGAGLEEFLRNDIWHQEWNYSEIERLFLSRDMREKSQSAASLFAACARPGFLRYIVMNCRIENFPSWMRPAIYEIRP